MLAKWSGPVTVIPNTPSQHLFQIMTHFPGQHIMETCTAPLSYRKSLHERNKKYDYRRVTAHIHLTLTKTISFFSNPPSTLTLPVSVPGRRNGVSPVKWQRWMRRFSSSGLLRRL